MLTEQDIIQLRKTKQEENLMKSVLLSIATGIEDLKKISKENKSFNYLVSDNSGLVQSLVELKKVISSIEKPDDADLIKAIKNLPNEIVFPKVDVEKTRDLLTKILIAVSKPDTDNSSILEEIRDLLYKDDKESELKSIEIYKNDGVSSEIVYNYNDKRVTEKIERGLAKTTIIYSEE
jgi:hypothetical protein